MKANPDTNSPGFVNAYAVEGKSIVRRPVRSEPKDTALLFGFSQIPQTDDFLVTDPSVGAAVLHFDPVSCDVSTLQTVNITGQTATCWSAISPATGTAFVTDAAVNRLVEISVPAGEIVSVTELENGDAGLIDLVAVGDFVYALAPGNATVMPYVTVFDATQKKMVQHFGLADMGVGPNVQGMAYSGGAGW